MSFDQVILLVSCYTFFVIFTNKVMTRIGVPSIIVYIMLGILTGVDGILKVDFTDAALTEKITTIALLLIIIEGGLNNKREDMKGAIGLGALLGTFGTLLGVILSSVLLNVLLKIPLYYSAIISSTLSITDYAATYSLLKNNKFIANHVMKILELESGLNDAIAISILYAIIDVDFLDFKYNLSNAVYKSIFHSTLELVIGAGIGLAVGKIFKYIFDKLSISDTNSIFFFVYASSLLGYGIASSIHASGFIATYIISSILGNTIKNKEVLKFSSTTGWIAQITAFIVLGMLVTPHHINIKDVMYGVYITLILTFLVRPSVIFIATSLSKLKFKEKLHLSLFNQRGALPIILSTMILSYTGVIGEFKGKMVFNLVFIISIFSMLLQVILIPLNSYFFSSNNKDQ